MAELHFPVMLSECIENLRIKPDGTYIDGTFGRGGHSREIAKRLSPSGKLICIDRDETAIEYGRETFSEFSNVQFIKGDFCNIPELVCEKADGILLDLGVSSPQLDESERGFSYMADGPLDMRMDRSQSLSAHGVVNTWSFEELRRIISEYGEERYAGKIASAIVREREKREISSTLQLVDIIKSAMPAPALREKQHPAKRTFQGIRIAVNDELGEIEAFLDKLPDMLKSGGRAVIITFHSLEDRLVKHAFRKAENPCTCPPEIPVCVCGKKPTLHVVSSKPYLPTKEEIDKNPRSRSAKVRVAERL
ncbi:MAG: 16S rRNA (cytosine(1402)-N(4))-methyltransferase RsmH [Oscillospiraceae bacterium]|nr:16S rRNA (cytosine(1402)-N(4))-methyltransferase RsmH [Oscillospiraceae bacterium]